MLMTRGDDPWTEADRCRILEEVREWLWLYLGRGQPTRQGGVAAAARLLDLPTSEVRRLCALHFLLSAEVAALLEHAAPAALRAAGRSVAATETRRGALRGRPDWSATHRRRASAGSDSTIYVYSAPHRDRRHEAALAVLLRAVRAAAATALAGTAAAGRDEASWQAVCTRCDQTAARMLGHPRLAGSPLLDGDAGEPPAGPHPSWWPPVAAARALHRRLVVDLDPAALAEALSARAVEPAGDDVLFELWAALATLAALEEAGWRRVALRLLGTASGGPFAVLRGPAGSRRRLALYVQHTPRAWREASRYAEVFARYGLAGGMRRPDMIVEVAEGGKRRWMLVEAKRTVDPAYIAESVYKVLGYLADFAPVLEGGPEPHALLLVWSLARAEAVPGSSPVVVTSPAGYAGALCSALAPHEPGGRQGTIDQCTGSS
jgi:hypothetical protein